MSKHHIYNKTAQDDKIKTQSNASKDVRVLLRPASVQTSAHHSQAPLTRAQNEKKSHSEALSHIPLADHVHFSGAVGAQSGADAT